jgi:alkyl hydroperoxide reductase subunit AhpC
VDSLYSHKVWEEVELSKMAGCSMPFPMLNDTTGSIGQMYGVSDAKNGTNYRGTFIIDDKGFVHAMEALTSPVGRSSSEILRRLKAYQTYVSTQKLIPVDWQPGDTTFIESIENVGKIWKVWKPEKGSN